MGFLNAIVDPAADHRSIFELLLAREVVFLAGRAQRDRREMISREIFSVANMASGVFFVVASFPDFFSQF